MINDTYSRNGLVILNLFLFLFCFGFYSFGNYIPLLLIPYFIFSVISNQKKLRLFYLTEFFILFFSLFYSNMLAIFDLMPIDSLIGRALYPIVFFVVGYCIFDFNGKEKIPAFFIIIPCSLSAYGLLSYIHTVDKYGSIEDAVFTLQARAVEGFWESNVISATGLNSYFALTIALFPIFLNKPSKIGLNKIYYFMLLFSFIASVFVSMVMANRTAFLVLIFSFLMYFIFVCKFRVNLYSLLKLIIFMIFLAFLYMLNFLNVKFFIESSAIYSRFTESDNADDPRLKAWADGLKSVLDNPWGGHLANIDVGYAHNLWIDIAVDGGVGPAFLMIFITFLSVYSIFNFFSIKNSDRLIKIIFTGFFSSLLVVFMIEPVMQGLFKIFLIYLLILGSLQKYVFQKS